MIRVKKPGSAMFTKPNNKYLFSAKKIRAELERSWPVLSVDTVLGMDLGGDLGSSVG